MKNERRGWGRRELCSSWLPMYVVPTKEAGVAPEAAVAMPGWLYRVSKRLLTRNPAHSPG